MDVKIDRNYETNINNFGSEMIIYEYKTAINIDVYFPQYNWTFKHARYDEFKKGKIKCPYEPRCCGVGFIGEGIYKSRENGKNTKCYMSWRNMLMRCYDEKYKEKYPAYINCECNKKWYNYQNFGEWYDENYYEIPGERMCLDKDILIKGNKIYSSETCVFVPERINLLFIKNDRIRGDLPIGVSYDGNRYKSQCKNGTHKYIRLGTYDTPEEAFQIYKQYKENVIKDVANEYKGKIPEKLYNALMNYKVEITD